MTDAEMIRMIAVERRRAADLVDSLDAGQLATPSLCDAWTVQQVAAHLIAPFAAPSWSLLALLVRHGFRLHAANAALAARIAERPARDIARVLRDNAETRFRPPVVGWYGQLTDLQIHAQDIRRPLGLPADLRPEPMRASLGFLTGGRAPGFVPRRRTAGLRLEATDLGWATGAGPVVRGPGEALMLALTGRAVALPELDGDGLPILRGRLSPVPSG
jgi:uncharacterized protein (TIGR03083 family)